MRCRFCYAELKHLVVDLGMSPLANAYLDIKSLNQTESYYPLRVFVCHECLLVQLSENVESPEKIFSNYLYFSSYSKTWLKHAEDFVNDVTEKFVYDQNSQIIEIASNDGYLLQYFKNKGIQVLGIEPASNISGIAQKKGINTINKFFGLKTAEELKKSGYQADLLIAINVLPHVPDIQDFIKGLKKILKSDGICVIQFSTYMLPFLQETEFDSIYHEHFFYFSLLSVQKILALFELIIFDVEELPIHGGSLRIYVKHVENTTIN
ncbi:MAG: methyltransferase domain-containing protein, partial [Patescibacteria group bacterium]|nr:methyltransferase domain-containing protein [Patescibacteria group bacterium]